LSLTNPQINEYDLLAGMYRDGYFPNFLVDKIKAILLALCERIESEQPKDEKSLLELTHAATEQINNLAEEFEENDSELETEAREIMAENFEFIVQAYGFQNIDIEEVIAPRDW
tara:strand:- start:1363 stop:1704 length:342 start_codon:yes stop_codon:yes gene_type:complete